MSTQPQNELLSEPSPNLMIPVAGVMPTRVTPDDMQNIVRGGVGRGSLVTPDEFPLAVPASSKASTFLSNDSRFDLIVLRAVASVKVVGGTFVEYHPLLIQITDPVRQTTLYSSPAPLFNVFGNAKNQADYRDYNGIPLLIPANVRLLFALTNLGGDNVEVSMSFVVRKRDSDNA